MLNYYMLRVILNKCLHILLLYNSFYLSNNSQRDDKTFIECIYEY